MRDVILIEGIYDLRKLIQNAYRMSKPQGLGFLHFKEGDFSEDELTNVIGDGTKDISLDYVNGRAVKLNIYKIDGKYHINGDWYDHTEEQLEKLLEQSKS